MPTQVDTQVRIESFRDCGIQPLDFRGHRMGYASIPWQRWWCNGSHAWLRPM